MKQIVVLSGKGGTGKTTITASLSTLFDDKLLVDADVDASNLHILFDLEEKEKNPYSGGSKAEIDPDKCVNCGYCSTLCRFDAIQNNDGIFSVDPLRCEGCGCCATFCPQKAIELKAAQNGWFRHKENEKFKLIDGELFPGEETSGGLVAVVRQNGMKHSTENKTPLIIIDGAPGIGCPVTSSITYTDLALIVTEPSKSGLHDLKRIVQTVKNFKTKCLLVINKFDLNDTLTSEIEKYSSEENLEIIGKIPYDTTVMTATRLGKPIIDFDCPVASEIRNIKTRLSEYI